MIETFWVTFCLVANYSHPAMPSWRFPGCIKNVGNEAPSFDRSTCFEIAGDSLSPVQKIRLLTLLLWSFRAKAGQDKKKETLKKNFFRLMVLAQFSNLLKLSGLNVTRWMWQKRFHTNGQKKGPSCLVNTVRKFESLKILLRKSWRKRVSF